MRTPSTEFVYNLPRLVRMQWPLAGDPQPLDPAFDRPIGEFVLSPDGKTVFSIAVNSQGTRAAFIGPTGVRQVSLPDLRLLEIGRLEGDPDDRISSGAYAGDRLVLAVRPRARTGGSRGVAGSACRSQSAASGGAWRA